MSTIESVLKNSIAIVSAICFIVMIVSGVARLVVLMWRGL